MIEKVNLWCKPYRAGSRTGAAPPGAAVCARSSHLDREHCILESISNRAWAARRALCVSYIHEVSDIHEVSACVMCRGRTSHRMAADSGAHLASREAPRRCA
jgi:hypothetical protein